MKRGKPRHFRGFLLRGLAVVLPPILTIVILLWAGNVVSQYLLVPVHQWVRWAAARALLDVREKGDLVAAAEPLPLLDHWGRGYRITKELEEQLRANSSTSEAPTELQRLAEKLSQGATDQETEDLLARYGGMIFVPVGSRYVPLKVHERVTWNTQEPIGQTPMDLYQQYVSYVHPPGIAWLSLPNLGSLLVLLVLLVGVYFAGHFLALGIGRALWQVFESRMVFRLPLVRNVYSSVKQVTDFVLSERQVQYRRVVAVQYPRRGIWSLGFVTSESMRSIEEAAGEPMVAVLIPTSPLPMTGYTINIARSEVLDLDLTVDQAIQFCVSCGVVVPPAEMPKLKGPDSAQQPLLPAIADQATADAAQ